MNYGAGLRSTPLPGGFFASGINCGVRRYRPDLGLIYSDDPITAVAVFTQNKLKAAPVIYCQNLLPAKNIKAIVTNSGQANAATGASGIEKNLAMAHAVAGQLCCDPNQVLTASTGVIGQDIEIEKITEGIPELVRRSSAVAENFATAIMTTDLVPKTIATTVELSSGPITLTGICKGSGMIHPNMATMLGYLLTDLKVEPEMAQALLKEATDLSFNMISVDADPSTNDTVYFLANGNSGVSLTQESDINAFKKALQDLCIELARSIVKDGEGATKLLETRVHGADSLDNARKWARSMVMSPLIKTAVHGEDPNWGRILARLGSEGVPAKCFESLSLKIQGTTIYRDGSEVSENLLAVRKELRNSEILIEVELPLGDVSATAWGCDLSQKYVQINAEYTT